VSARASFGPTSRRHARRRSTRSSDHQDASPFAALLEDLLDAMPYVRGAAIVDFEGETVDLAGEVDTFEMKVAAATMQLTLADLRAQPVHGGVLELRLATTRQGCVVRVLDDSYSLVLVARPLATFVLSERVLLEAEHRIRIEAGLPARAPLQWHRTEVDLDARHRPTRIRAAASLLDTEPPAWLLVEVLGAVVDSPAAPRAYRVRLESGAELTLEREGRALWFVDAPIADGSKHRPFARGFHEVVRRDG
jgi:hypothetical protein